MPELEEMFCTDGEYGACSESFREVRAPLSGCVTLLRVRLPRTGIFASCKSCERLKRLTLHG